jgi:ATP-dependent Clp protease adaptor protein ClpS
MATNLAERISAAADTAREEATSRSTQPLPPHAVVLHNDDLNSCEFVVEVLQKVFRYPQPKAVTLMMHAHLRGRSLIWSGQKEVAELKADQVRSCGPDPIAKARGASPLRVTVEPLPS